MPSSFESLRGRKVYVDLVDPFRPELILKYSGIIQAVEGTVFLLNEVRRFEFNRSNPSQFACEAKLADIGGIYGELCINLASTHILEMRFAS